MDNPETLTTLDTQDTGKDKKIQTGNWKDKQNGTPKTGISLIRD